MIETGYKPEFGLGALYQGFNAGNADQSAQEELLKQFLANQHAQVQNPLDEQTTAQNLLANHYKTDPRYQTGMTDMIEGQGYSNLAAGQTAQGLQPFKEKAERRGLENAFRASDVQNSIYQLDDMIGTEQNPLTRMAMVKERERLTRNLKENSKFMGQRELKETGTDSAEYIAELRAENDRFKAQQKAGGTSKDPYMEWNKLAPAKRAGILEYAKQMGINPITRQPIQSPEEQLALDKMYEQDVALASMQSPEGRTAGKIDLPKLTEGQIPVTPVPQTRTRDSSVSQPKLPAGWSLKQ